MAHTPMGGAVAKPVKRRRPDLHTDPARQPSTPRQPKGNPHYVEQVTYVRKQHYQRPFLWQLQQVPTPKRQTSEQGERD